MTKTEKSAFTLAEVLITLGVIGVVAAMTLPTLIHNYQVKQWETGLKRSYTILSNGFQKVMADTGCPDLECTGIFVPKDGATSVVNNTEDPIFNDRMEEIAKKIFNATKICKYGDTTCLPAMQINRLKGGTPVQRVPGNGFTMMLADGTIAFIQNFGCSTTKYKNKKICGWIVVDINGLNGPNTLGKDVWGLGRLYSDGQIYPNTSWDYAVTNSATPETYTNYWRNNPGLCGHAGIKLKDDTQAEINGQDCAARVMENNWEIDYLK